MKFAAETNEIAGSDAQKLPHAPDGTDVPSEMPGKTEAKPASNLPGGKQEFFDPTTLALSGGSLGLANWPQAQALDKAYSVDRSMIQVERMAQFVKQEVAKVKQSGADSLAVSLKLDSRTELSLQVTTRDGQVQAFLRCERGDAAGIGAHWGELQNSLARQNVQLMPLQNSLSQRNSTFTPPTAETPARGFQQPSQKPHREAPEAREELPLAAADMKPIPARGSTSRTSSRQGWESWA